VVLALGGEAGEREEEEARLTLLGLGTPLWTTRHRVQATQANHDKGYQGRLLRWCAHTISPRLSSARSRLSIPPPLPVRVGRLPGVYTSWDDCAAQVNGFQDARHKKFPTRQEAEAFIAGGGGPSSAANVLTGPVVTSRLRNKRSSDAAGAIERAVKRQKQGSAAGGSGSAAGGGAGDPVFGRGSSSRRRVYCDGSSRGNGKRGAVAGIGVFWGHEAGAKCAPSRSVFSA